MLNKRDIFGLISFPVLLFQFLFCYILERKDKKWFKRDIIVLVSFLILFVSISFLVNIGKEMSLPGFHNGRTSLPTSYLVIDYFIYVLSQIYTYSIYAYIKYIHASIIYTYTCHRIGL